MDKKILIIAVSIVIIACILAIMGFNKKSSEPVNIEPTVQTNQEETQPAKAEPIDEKTQTESSAQPIVKPVGTPVIKPSKNVSNVVKPAVETKSALSEKETRQVTEEAVKPVLYQDDNTKEVVITTEYKMASPAKYSFK